MGVRGLGPGWENEVEMLAEEAWEPVPGQKDVQGTGGAGIEGGIEGENGSGGWGWGGTLIETGVPGKWGPAWVSSNRGQRTVP